MVERIKKAMEPPVFGDSREKTRIARFLNGILWAIGLLALALAPFVVALNETGIARLFSLIASVGFLAFVWGLQRMLHRGLVRLASTLLVLLLWALFSGALYAFGGIRNPLVGGYLIVIFLAGLLLGRRGAVVFGALSVVGALFIFVAELNDAILLPLQASPDPGSLVMLFAVSAITTVLVGFTLRDLTGALERAKRNEEALIESNRALRESRDQLQVQALEMERHTRYLEAIAQVAQEAASVLDVEQMLDEAVDSILSRFDFYRLGVFLVGPAGEWAELRAAAGEAVDETLENAFRVRVGKEGIVGFVTGSGEPYVTADVLDDAFYVADSDVAQTRSEMALPLRARGKIIGALDVQSAQPGAFDREDVAVFQTLADQLAMAISNARLFEQLQGSLEAERRAYAEIGREAWAEMLRARPYWGYRYHRGNVAPLTGKPGTRDGDGRSSDDERAHVTGEGHETRQDRAIAVEVPIKLRGKVIGTMRASKDPGAADWSPEERTMMESLAGQLGAALESARLYEDSTRRAQRERLVAEITAKVRASSDVESVMRTAVQELGRLTGVDRALVQLAKEPTSPEEPGA